MRSLAALYLDVRGPWQDPTNSYNLDFNQVPLMHILSNCVSKMKIDYSKVPRVTVWKTLQAEEDSVESLDMGSTGNTEPTNDKIYIPRELIRDWAMATTDPFPDMHGLRAYATHEAELWTRLNTNILDIDYCRVASTWPEPVVSETALEIELKTHFNTVNLALEKTAVNGKSVMIAGGKSARAGDEEAKITSEPDRATFFAPTKETVPMFCFSGKLDHRGSKSVRNVMPGEIKVSYKFRRSFLDAMDESPKRKNNHTPDYPKREQAEMVFTQIYQYMNERSSATGYLITDQELICVRRTPEERCGLRYGVIDISPSIPLSAPEGQLNAKLALWYLHHKYAMKHPHLSDLPRTKKPAGWSQKVRTIRYARVLGPSAESGSGYSTRSKARKAQANEDGSAWGSTSW